MSQQPNARKGRTVALLISAAGGVSGVGSGARPSPDAVALCNFALQKVLDPATDNLVAVHAIDLGLGRGRGAVEVPAPPHAPPPGWFPPALAAAFPTLRRATAVQLEAGAAGAEYKLTGLTS
jgi:hypothetical protein